MTTAFDLDAYFERIRYAGDRSPTLDTLRAIHLRHTEAIPFENLNPFLGWPVPLDARALQEKIVRRGRGGYCFEQNLLLNHALTALGFRVTGLAGRVLWNAPEDAVTRRSHMLLRVDLTRESYIADVGFGGQTLTGPLRLQPDVEQPTPHEPSRLTRVGAEYILQAKIAGAWKTLYRRLLTTAAELRGTLEDTFLLKLPNAPELDAALARVTTRPGQAHRREEE